MRTTVSIEDTLLEQAKRRAAQRGQTLGQFLEDAVRHELVSEPTSNTAVSLPVFNGKMGVRPGIDLTSTRAMLDALDEADDDRY